MRATFERVAVGLAPQAPLKTIHALRRRGLIALSDLGVDRNVWYVPIPVHHDWCVWCAYAGEDDGDERGSKHAVTD
jgi:hypothetical protein